MEKLDEDPEDEVLPNTILSEALGEMVMRDTFIDGLSLGIWDEEFGYYRAEKDITTQEDMKNGIW